MAETRRIAIGALSKRRPGADPLAGMEDARIDQTLVFAPRSSAWYERQTLTCSSSRAGRIGQLGGHPAIRLTAPPPPGEHS